MPLDIKQAQQKLSVELENRYRMSNNNSDTISIFYETRKPPLELQEIREEGYLGFSVKLKQAKRA